MPVVWDAHFDSFAEEHLRTSREHCMKLMRRISLQRTAMRYMAVMTNNHRYGLKAVAYTLVGKFYSWVCLQKLLSGCKVLSALRRNMREGKTRALIMGRIMQHVLGNGGPAAMMQLLPYMNYYTWRTEDVLGPRYTTKRVRYHELEDEEGAAVAPARNVRRRVQLADEVPPQNFPELFVE
jgi:hypothetical protein